MSMRLSPERTSTAAERLASRLPCTRAVCCGPTGGEGSPPRIVMVWKPMHEHLLSHKPGKKAVDIQCPATDSAIHRWLPPEFGDTAPHHDRRSPLYATLWQGQCSGVIRAGCRLLACSTQSS